MIAKVSVAVLLAAPLLAASMPMSKPEDAGMSSDRLKRVAAIVKAHVDTGDIGGAVTLVARKGKVVHLEAHGLMDIEAKKPMGTDTLFRMASMTKPVTAVAILMLMEEGKLILADPVSKYVPEFKSPKVAVWNHPNDPLGAGLRLVPANREISIQDLLTHTSGLANGNEGPAGEYVRRANLPQTGSLADRVKRLASLPLNFQPGAQWEYSPSTGFDTLGRIVEIQSGMSLEQFFAKRIFEPLGMRSTFFVIPQNRTADVATLYSKTEKGLSKTTAAERDYFSGAGGLTGSAQDYLAFCQMLLNGGQANGVRLLSRKTVELMGDNAIGDLDLRNYINPDHDLKGYGFGLGVRVRKSTGRSGWLGSSGDFGWAGANGTYFWVDPKEQLVGIIMMSTRTLRLRTEFPNLVYAAISD